MKSLVKFSLGLLLAQSAAAQQAPQQAPASRQDPAAIREVVEQFLHTQTAGLPGHVSITVNSLDNRTNLPACAAPEAFLTGGSKAWGKTTVGVRCNAPSNWTVYISATVRVTGEYLTTAAPLAQGQIVGPNDVVKTKGDLTLLPPGILTDSSQAVGRSLVISLAAGTPLRQDSLRNQQVVQQGQSVRVMTTGPGFKIGTEGRALNNGSDGQVVQARTANGQVVSGIARLGGVVEVTY